MASAAQEPAPADAHDNIVVPMQVALEAFEAGLFDKAEQLAFDLAHDSPPWPRAWLLVAAARERRGEMARAIDAYNQFQTACPTDPLRAYVASRLGACSGSADTLAPPSSRLTEQDRRHLARAQSKPVTVTTGKLTVTAPNAKLAALVARQAQADLARITTLCATQFQQPVEIYVWADRAEYTAHAQHAEEWAGGNSSVYRQGERIVRRIDLMQRDEQGNFATILIDRILPHEMCHLVLRDYFGQAPCPLYLNEGLAMLAESNIDNDRVLLAGAALGGDGKIPLPKLLGISKLPNDPAVFYAQSFSLMAFLRSRLTREQFADLLAHTRSGCTLADALGRALYVSQDDSLLQALVEAWENDATEQAHLLQALRKDGSR